MIALALALALGAAPGGVATSLSPPPVRLYRVVWQRPLVAPRVLEWRPAERGGVAVDPASGLVVAGTRDGWLHARRPDGSVAWELRGDGVFGPPAIEGDTVYVGASDGRLHAIALSTGKERWRYRAEEDLSTRPAVAHGMVFVASLQDTLFALDAASGEWRWHHRRETKGSRFTIFGAASAIAGPEAVYAAYSDGYAAALDPATGAARWERRVAPAGDQLDIDALAYDGGRLYAAAYSGAVLALDAATGEVVWTFETPGAAQLTLAGGLVVAVTATSVHGLATTDGGAVWTTPLHGVPAGAPAVSGKWLLVPAGQGGLRWIEIASGRTLRVFDPGTGVSGSPAAAGTRVYVLSNGGDLFALERS
jgi:outer membrane protein assembly factor BamB